jgi:broad specificity phosphatase PhoE
MRIYLLRHGESEANMEGVISEDPAHPYPLTPMGIAHAEVVAEELREVPFTHIYVSEHVRTRETAEILVQAWLEGNDQGKKEASEEEAVIEVEVDGVEPAPPKHAKFPISVDARLNERHSGMEGQPVGNFNSLVKPDPVNIKPEGGESFREQMERLRAFMDQVAERHVDCTVLAVSHEDPILAAQAVAGRSPEEAARGDIANCEWVMIEWPPAEKTGKNGSNGGGARQVEGENKSG